MFTQTIFQRFSWAVGRKCNYYFNCITFYKLDGLDSSIFGFIRFWTDSNQLLLYIHFSMQTSWYPYCHQHYQHYHHHQHRVVNVAYDPQSCAYMILDNMCLTFKFTILYTLLIISEVKKWFCWYWCFFYSACANCSNIFL